jgi:hypothetical protein
MQQEGQLCACSRLGSVQAAVSMGMHQNLTPWPVLALVICSGRVHKGQHSSSHGWVAWIQPRTRKQPSASVQPVALVCQPHVSLAVTLGTNTGTLHQAARGC